MKSRTRTGMLKLGEGLQGVDLYKLLCIEEEDTGKIGEKELKKAYQQACLLYHPDKVKVKARLTSSWS